MTSRRFAFTSYDEKKPVFHDSCGYLCYQREICPTTQREHWQGYVEFEGNGGLRFSTCKKRIGIECRLVDCKGSGEQNRTYCSKPESAIANTFEEFGKLGKQGSRSDIKAVVDMVVDGKTNCEIIDAHPDVYLRMCRNIAVVRRDKMPKRKIGGPMPTVMWRWGPPGVGKSRWVYDNFDEKDIYDKPDATKWFDGYTGQKVMIINEFEFSKEFSREYLLRICDRYPINVQTKGDYVPFSASTIILTSNENPKKIINDDIFWGRWERRINIIECKEEIEPEVEDLWAMLGL